MYLKKPFRSMSAQYTQMNFQTHSWLRYLIEIVAVHSVSSNALRETLPMISNSQFTQIPLITNKYASFFCSKTPLTLSSIHTLIETIFPIYHFLQFYTTILYDYNKIFHNFIKIFYMKSNKFHIYFSYRVELSNNMNVF